MGHGEGQLGGGISRLLHRPGKEESQLEQTTWEVSQQASEWGNVGTGLNMAMAAYNIYVIPALFRGLAREGS